jgi:predicted porin
LGLEIGYQDVEGDKTTGNNTGESGGDGFDYIHWRIGLSYEIKGFELGLSYQDTNEQDFLGNAADSRVVFSVSRSL